MQQVQENGTLCQSVQIQDRQSDPERTINGQQHRIMAKNRPYSTRQRFHKAILLVQGQPIEFVIDTGSPVTIIPLIISPTEIHKTTKCFVDVNKNPINFESEAMVEVETEKSKEILPILITKNKNSPPLMGLDWLDKLEIGLQGNKNTNIIRHIETDGRRQKIINEYEDLFKNNHTIKDLTTDMQLKKYTKPIQQKGRPVPIHF